MQIRANGETVQLLGPRKARVRSSSGTSWYAVDLDEGDGFCTCQGFVYRKRCRHLEVVRKIMAGEAEVDLQERLIDVPSPLTVARDLDLATSRYQAWDRIEASGRTPVGITVGNPRFKLKYELAGYVRELAPYGALFKINDRMAFTDAYFEKLDGLGLATIAQALSERGERLVLLCYEDLDKPEEWCHRQVFAEWWEQKTGRKVPELPRVAQSDRAPGRVPGGRRFESSPAV